VWLDGQEITQFTYFQQAGGIPCDPVSVEITYGLERIAIALQNVTSFRDIKWTDSVTYGDVNLQGEQEHSKYYFEAADVERLHEMFINYEAEAKFALEKSLVLPAHDYVLKCSHTFNVLDTRGAIGVTERAAYFGKMRNLARAVAEAYVKQRESLGYPLKKSEVGTQKPATRNQRLATSRKPETLLLEIGVEELPSSDVESAVAQLNEVAPKMLAESRLSHGEVKVFATPRRLSLLIKKMIARQPDVEKVLKGPSADRAYDAQGNPTPAAQGFAKGKGVPVESLEKREMDGGSYVVAVVREVGKPASEVLSELLPKMIAAIKFEKAMRWNASGVSFSRPLRWIVAMLGATVIPFDYAGVKSGNVSHGLHPLGSPAIKIKSADTYMKTLRAAKIEIDQAKRGAEVLKQVKKLAAKVGGTITDEDVLGEVTNLVERPTALLGSFDESYLELPRDVLISVMKKHQRYFPVEKNGKLLPNFVVVRNGDALHLDWVREGNEHVIRARFADANFFVREDVKEKLEAYRAKLSSLTFQTKLGSMLDKSERIEKLTGVIAKMLELGGNDSKDALRAAHLCKADLATQMVVEMTSLQGIMGREYALRSGESDVVANAIGEQYQTVPQSKSGLTVALADRLDSLAGLFGVGLIPTGAKDPFGLRRAALGIVQPLIEHKISFDLKVALRGAGAVQPVLLKQETYQQILDFIIGRLRVVLIDEGYRYDVVDAVIAPNGCGHDPYQAKESAAQLTKWVARDDWSTILPAYARCVRITRDQKQVYEVNPSNFVLDAEKNLWNVYQDAPRTLDAVTSVDGFLNSFLPMIPAVNKFFDDVLVMDKDQAVRENRLGLLQKISGMAQGVADLSKLEGF
jgi:glycyl-tRNA synthetase